MIRTIWKPALALGAVLAVSGAASAGDRDTLLLGGGAPGSTTMTLGGTGTVAAAVTEDTELTGGYRYGGYRYGGYYGYRGGYGGYGYGHKGYYYNGYRPYYGNYGGFNYYRPAYYYAPRPAYYTTYYPSFYYPRPVYYGSGFSFYIGISGDAGTGAPAVHLGTGLAQPMATPTPPADGTFPYDGGPANPVPLPKADTQPIPPANPAVATDLPISLKPKPAAPPSKYKAYGEK